MNMALTARCFQIFFFFGCGYSLLIADCLEINAFNTLGDGKSFSPGSKAILQCVINPYTGGQTWKVDSVSVADCGFVLCVENSSNPDRYAFTPNVTTGSFIFTIDPILYRDNGNVIECLDGSSTINHTVVVAGLSNSTCEHDFKICIYLAIGELLHFIVSIQHIYQSVALYSFQKRIGSIRLIWLNFLAWFPIIGCLIFKGILGHCHEGQCRDCQKQYPAEGYCYNCKANLCVRCFKRHQPLHKTWQIGNTCDQCKVKCMPEYCCLKCEWYLCKLCLRKPDTLNNHQCKQRTKMRNLKQGKRKCHDCKKETDAGHICFICMDHLCTNCFNNHYKHHSAKRQGVTKCTHCNISQEQPNIKGYCLTCSDILCEQCLETNDSFDKHETRQIYREVNNIKTKYKCLLALACFPGLSCVGVLLLWIICWKKIKKQTITFILPTVVGCIVAVAHPLVVLKACLAACECEILQWWYILLLAIKYTFLAWIPSAIVLVFIKLLEDSFYCDDCKNNSQVHGYCIECNQYLCDICVRKHKNIFHYIVKHSQKKGEENYFKTCGHKNEMFYCTNSKRFICESCKVCRINTIRQHVKKCNNSSSFENHQKDIICHDMLSGKDLCYTCFCKLSEIRRHIKDAFNQRLKCQYTIGDVQCQSASADAYCLTCKLCLCQECLEKHHLNLDARQCYKHKTQSTCLFCDNCLTKDGKGNRKVKEAEYYHVELNCVLCAQCILERSDWKRNGHQITEMNFKAEGSQNNPCEVHKAMVNLRHEVEFELPEDTTTTDRVRCNVCEIVMCGTCFKDHFKITNFLHHYQYNDIVRTKEKESDTRKTCTKCSVECNPEYFCLKCKCYLCRVCLKEPITSNNHRCKQRNKRLDLEQGEHKCHDCKNETDAGNYCLICKDNICTDCFNSHYTFDQHSASRQDQYDAFFACDENNCREARVETLCLDCKKHLCEKCIKNEKDHEENHTIIKKNYFHDPLFRRKKIFCQKDHNGEEYPAECLDLNTQHAMCASCFDDSTTDNTSGDQSKQCQLCPDKIKRPVNVYCLVCRGYMCVTCFKWHRRFKQSWQEQGFYKMLEEKNIKEAEPSPKRSVPSSVVFRIIAGPIPFFDIFHSCCSNDATVTPIEQKQLEKPKEREHQHLGQSTADIVVAVETVSKAKHRDGETKL